MAEQTTFQGHFEKEQSNPAKHTTGATMSTNKSSNLATSCSDKTFQVRFSAVMLVSFITDLYLFVYGCRW